MAPAVRLTSARSVTPLAFEVRVRARVSASEPAAAAVMPTVALLPAVTLALAPLSVRLALVFAAATSRLSW